ncbi:protein DEEPER ROOTING 1-like isoform X2 [Amaranthus tricolor]|uniref:protein DEEPER ROOTING 1-like isoform X2 n=1 Tax=Amaranthus tricolor TaxID=29722 RepID=UPI00258E476B|nr:protein DEEPER ROOTING 1-like isoform X2 [Amaranthus tricolor]
MKLLSWVQTKLNGKQSNNNNTNIYASNTIDQTPQFGGQKEEFSDWPQGILSIGTLFIKPSKDEQNESSIASQNPTLEEVEELHKELDKLIKSSNDHLNSLDDQVENEQNYARPASTFNKEEDEEEECDDHQQVSTIMPNKAKNDVYLDKNGRKVMVNKKSLSFVLKKMFVCGSIGGFSPTPSLRDPTIQEPPKSTMTKILRAMLRKKIYPQNSCPTMQRKKYLGSGLIDQIINNYDDQDYFDADEGNKTSKWDKSDEQCLPSHA